jgi:hypothetical protein
MHIHKCIHKLSPSYSDSIALTHTLSLSHTNSFSLSLSHTHTHTHLEQSEITFASAWNACCTSLAGIIVARRAVSCVSAASTLRCLISAPCVYVCMCVCACVRVWGRGKHLQAAMLIAHTLGPSRRHTHTIIHNHTYTITHTLFVFLSLSLSHTHTHTSTGFPRKHTHTHNHTHTHTCGSFQEAGRLLLLCLTRMCEARTVSAVGRSHLHTHVYESTCEYIYIYIHE